MVTVCENIWEKRKTLLRSEYNKRRWKQKKTIGIVFKFKSKFTGNQGVGREFYKSKRDENFSIESAVTSNSFLWQNLDVNLLCFNPWSQSTKTFIRIIAMKIVIKSHRETIK